MALTLLYLFKNDLKVINVTNRSLLNSDKKFTKNLMSKTINILMSSYFKNSSTDLVEFYV